MPLSGVGHGQTCEAWRIQSDNSALKTELGVDARVYFRTVNGHTSVAVQLASPPSAEAAAAKRNISDVVNRNFRAKAERVDVSF